MSAVTNQMKDGHEIKIQATCKIGDESFVSNGVITFAEAKGDEVYAQWEMYDSKGNRIAGVAQTYYFSGDEPTESRILETVRYNIEHYRIDRRRIFFDLEILR